MYYLKIAVLLLASAVVYADSNLAFTGAYIAAAPPGAAAIAAYMTIENPGGSPRRIAAISSGDFAEVQIHRSIIDKGIARMEQMDYLALEPGSRLELKPGGIHLMLLEPARDYEPGETILLELKETDGTLHNLALKVQRVTKAPEAHHH